MIRRERIIRSLHLPAVRRRTTRPRYLRRRWLAALGILSLIVCGLGAWVYSDPAVVPDAVDMAREIFGPDAVASVEAWAFQTQDAYRQARYQATGASNSLKWSAPAATPAPVAASAPPGAPAAPVATAQSPNVTAQGAAGQTGTSGIWSPFVYDAAGRPVLERAIVTPDPDRPYVETALVRIDLRDTQLHLVAGTLEPLSTVRIRRLGMIPIVDQRPGRLLAAFNGGFKAANGAFGMAVNGVTLLPPSDGLATLAIYRDGHVRLGIWGSDIGPAPDMTAYRQNCPLLLDGGKLTPQAETDAPTLWGRTVKNKIATWRSGLGLTADGRYLIYAAGDGLTVPTLAAALAAGGADRGMQLDINSWWTRFVTYAPTSGGSGLVAQKLFDSMVGNERQFLAPDTRDFFYLTTR